MITIKELNKMKPTKSLLAIILVVVLIIGCAAFFFFNRTGLLFDAEEGVCPRCLNHDVRRWEYGFGVGDTDEVIGGGCVVEKDSPKYHCDVCGFDWGDSYE